jgi:hypothetical protein
MRRRRFMKLMAATAAVVLTQPVERSLAAAAAKRPAPAEPETISAATRKELASQKKSVADMLKAIRAYKLPPGSRPAFVFRAEKRSDSRA